MTLSWAELLIAVLGSAGVASVVSTFLEPWRDRRRARREKEAELFGMLARSYQSKDILAARALEHPLNALEHVRDYATSTDFDGFNTLLTLYVPRSLGARVRQFNEVSSEVSQWAENTALAYYNLTQNPQSSDAPGPNPVQQAAYQKLRDEYEPLMERFHTVGQDLLTRARRRLGVDPVFVKDKWLPLSGHRGPAA